MNLWTRANKKCACGGTAITALFPTVRNGCGEFDLDDLEKWLRCYQKMSYVRSMIK